MADPEEQRGVQIIQREIVLLLIIAAAAVPLYLFTRSMAEANRHRNARIAMDLYRRAEQQLGAGHVETALVSLRQAVTNDRNNRRYAFALARTLAAGDHDDEARLALLRLREAAPEEPQINLELARLAARHRNLPEAINYYHHALYGLWTGERVDERRREVRLELIRLFLDRRQRSRALAELLVMSAEAPQTAGARRQMAGLFLEAGDLPRALEQFSAATDVDPKDVAALRGAGMTAFQMGDYRESARFLARAQKLENGGSSVGELLETARLVESHDPLAPRLRRSEQARRVTAGLDQAARRLGDCISRESGTGAFRPSVLEKLRGDVNSMRAIITPEALRADPDLIHNSVDLISTTEELAAERCGAPRGFDHALLLIGRRHPAVAP